MALPTFQSWLEQRHRDRREPLHIPAADHLMQLIVASGAAGVSRKRLGGVIDLPPQLLDQLLAALFQLGQVAVLHHPICGTYYRSSGAGTAMAESAKPSREGQDSSLQASGLSPSC